MIDDDAPGPYSEPPDDLAEQVVAAVKARLSQKELAAFLDLDLDDLEPRVLSVDPVPIFGLSIQQPVSAERMQRLLEPSDWGFRITIETKDGEKTLMASAGPARGTGYSYSSMLTLPDGFLAADVETLARSDAAARSWAYLKVPAYYLEAYWFRTGDPDRDRVLFLKEPFRRFPLFSSTSMQTVPLKAFVAYMNQSLKKGAPLLGPPEMTDGKGYD